MIIATLMAEAGAGTPLDHYAWLAVGGVFICLVALVMGANAIDDFLERRRGKPGQPPNEQLESSHENLAVRVDGIENDVSNIREELKVDRKQNEIHASTRASAMYRKLDETRVELERKMEKHADDRSEATEKIHEHLRNVDTMVGEVTATNNLQSQRLAQIDAKLDRLIERRST